MKFLAIFLIGCSFKRGREGQGDDNHISSQSSKYPIMEFRSDSIDSLPPDPPPVLIRPHFMFTIVELSLPNKEPKGSKFFLHVIFQFEVKLCELGSFETKGEPPDVSERRREKIRSMALQVATCPYREKISGYADQRIDELGYTPTTGEEERLTKLYFHACWWSEHSKLNDPFNDNQKKLGEYWKWVRDLFHNVDSSS